MAKRITWYDEFCEYCGAQINSWDKRISKTLQFTFPICEKCMAEEYGMTVEYLRDVMQRRYGAHPCEGL